MVATPDLGPGGPRDLQKSFRQQGKVRDGLLQPGPAATGNAAKDEVRRAEQQLGVAGPDARGDQLRRGGERGR